MSTACKKSLFTSPVPRQKNPPNDNCGLGLGLYISAELIKAAKGQIKGISQGLNKGSTFIVQLPAVKVDVPATGR
jgi:signal transduction histidine kinase